jgi:hypothetical protein
LPPCLNANQRRRSQEMEGRRGRPPNMHRRPAFRAQRFWRSHGGCANCESSCTSTPTTPPLMQPCSRILAFSGTSKQPSHQTRNKHARTRLAAPRTLAHFATGRKYALPRRRVVKHQPLLVRVSRWLDGCKAEPEVSPSPCIWRSKQRAEHLTVVICLGRSMTAISKAPRRSSARLSPERVA